MEKEIICTIGIGDFALDDDYTFYTDGTIKRFYDQSYYKQSITEYVDYKNISENRKKKLIDKCPKEHLKVISKILDK